MSTPSLDRPLWVSGLSVHHFAAIRPGTGYTLEEFSPVLNLIHGANGCGKTTTAMALRHLLWHGSASSTYASVEARLHQGDQSWQLEQHGTHVQIHPLQGASQQPPLAPPETHSRYVWTLRDLLTAEDEDLAARVAREMAGGVDLHALRKELGVHRPPQAPRNLHNAYRDTESKLREAKQKQHQLQSQARQLDHLREEHARLEQQQACVADLKLALERLQLRREKAIAEAEAQAFPAGMDAVHTGDSARAANWIQSLEQNRNEQDLLNREENGLIRMEPDWASRSLDDLQRAHRGLQNAENRLQEAERQLAETRSRNQQKARQEEQIRKRLGLNEEALSVWTTGYDFPELRIWIQKVLKEAALTQAVETAQEALPPAAMDGPDATALRIAARNLSQAINDWAPAFPRPRFAGVVSWLLFAGLCMVYRESIPQALLLLLLLPPLLGFGIHTFKRQQGQSSLRRQLGSDLNLPHHLDLPALENLLREVNQKLELASEQERSKQAYRRLENLQAQRDALRKEMNALQASLPTLPGGTIVPEEGLAHFLEDLQHWRDLHDDRTVAEQQEKEAEAMAAECRQRLQECSEPWGDAEDVEGLLDRLQAEMHRRNALDALRLKRRTLEEEAERQQSQIQEIFERHGLPPDRGQDIAAREQLLEGWEQNQQTLRVKNERLADLDRQLATHPEWDHWLEDNVQEALGAAEKAREAARSLFGQITELEINIGQAKDGRDVHALQETLERDRIALERNRQEALEARVRTEVMDWLQDAVRDTRRPEVLDTANHHLSRFTRGTLSLHLQFQEGGETFVASTPGQPQRPLHTLSGGERAQLIMAVRLAFLDQQEAAPMPLFVDEALGTSDDERAQAILHTLIDIAQQGRQIFYFTAQSDEVGKWIQALEGEDLSPRIIDLASVRHQTPAQPIALPASFTPAPAPDRNRQPGESDADWATRLGVPAWNPHQPVEDLPLFLLFHNQDAALVRCLEYGLQTWGQLQHLIGADALQHGLTPAEIRNLQAQATAVQCLTAAWRIHRPPPLPPEWIVGNDIVSDAFQQPILDLLQQVRGEASQLIAQLENKAVPRWRQDKTEALREQLEAEGYLTDQSPLNSLALRAHALAAMAKTPFASDLQPADWDRWQGLFPTETRP